MVKILKQGEIRSASDFSRLNIVDWGRLNGYWKHDITVPIKIIDTWLARNATYTLIEDDLTAYPERSDWPEWRHAGNGNHQYLGHLYWNMFHECFSGEGTLEFADAPDFQGTFSFPDKKTTAFYGDIGRISISSFILNVLDRFNVGDLWISVLDERHEVIIEIHADIHRAIMDNAERNFKALLQKINSPQP